MYNKDIINSLVEYIESLNGVADKEKVKTLVQNKFSLIKERSVFYNEDFAIRFGYNGKNNKKQISNTVLGLSVIKNYDIILEVYKSAPNLLDEKCFYGFMWAIAGNVYKRWCKNKARNRECELSEDIVFAEDLMELENDNLFLLRRELTLLTKKYRKAVILYYIENMSCCEISNNLGISESMVKYLLFQSRKIIKEGMSMERNYGSQSYNPRELTIAFWGNGVNRYYHLGDSKIAQNILFACYNDKLKAEQISLEIGVALPYMEDKLNELLEYELIKKDGVRYYTNIAIFTEDFMNEVGVKTRQLRERIADVLQTSIAENEEKVRSIGFFGADMRNSTLQWQMVTFILYKAIIDIFQNKIQMHYPKDKFGAECFVWGIEKGKRSDWLSRFGFGSAHAVNAAGDYIQFMDVPINGEMMQHYYFNRQTTTNVFLDIAKGNVEKFSENDKVLAADMIRKGYVLSSESGLLVNVPVFTADQYQKLNDIFALTAEQISNEAEALMEVVTKIVKNHIPAHLKRYARNMAYLRLFEDTISEPISILYEKDYLVPYIGDGMHPTTRIVLM